MYIEEDVQKYVVLQYFWLEEYLKYFCDIGKSIEIAEKCFLSVCSCCDCSAVGCFLGSSLVAVVCQLLCSLLQCELKQRRYMQHCVASPPFEQTGSFIDIWYFSGFTVPASCGLMVSSAAAPYCHFSLSVVTDGHQRELELLWSAEGVTLMLHPSFYHCCLIHSIPEKVEMSSQGGLVKTTLSILKKEP